MNLKMKNHQKLCTMCELFECSSSVVVHTINKNKKKEGTRYDMMVDLILLGIVVEVCSDGRFDVLVVLVGYINS